MSRIWNLPARRLVHQSFSDGESLGEGWESGFELRDKSVINLKSPRLDAVQSSLEERSEAVRQVLRASTAEYNAAIRQEANWRGWRSQTAELAGGRV